MGEPITYVCDRPFSVGPYIARRRAASRVDGRIYPRRLHGCCCKVRATSTHPPAAIHETGTFFWGFHPQTPDARASRSERTPCNVRATSTHPLPIHETGTFFWGFHPQTPDARASRSERTPPPSRDDPPTTRRYFRA